MDPSEALVKLRAMVHAEHAIGSQWTPEYANQRCALWAEQFESLDDWLSKGGFLPPDWAPDEAKEALSLYREYHECEGDREDEDDKRWDFIEAALSVLKRLAGVTDEELVHG